MGSSGSKEKQEADQRRLEAEVAQQRKAADDAAAVKAFEKQLGLAFDEGRMEGFTAGRLSIEATYYETLSYIALGVVFTWITTVFAMWTRAENKLQTVKQACEERIKVHETQLATYRTAEQRVVDVEKALENCRAMFDAQAARLTKAKRSLLRERKARVMVVRKYGFSKKQLQSAYTAQQRLTAELASLRMAAGIAAVGGLGVLLVTFGKQLLDHGHGGGHAAAPPAPIEAPPAPAAASTAEH